STAPMNLTQKRTYSQLVRDKPVVHRFKYFNDVEFVDVDKLFSIIVMVDAKFPTEDLGEKQHFILMDAT
ncbi:hypothetical protein E2562_021708, partial [Oryza meyeriana var. granulata]